MSATFAQPSPNVMAMIINPLLGSVADTFSLRLGSTATRGALVLREADAEPHDISATILLTGRAKGVICLGFDRLTALEIAARLVGGSGWKLTPAVIEAVGDITNDIADATRSKLDMGLNMGVPTLVHRDDLEVRFPSGSDPMRLHFDSDAGPFFIDFGFVVSGL